MKVTIYGSGYVGLVTGACFAEVGNHVLCVNVDKEKIRALKDGIIPIHEPGLDDIIHAASKSGHIDFTSDMDRAVAHADVQFIAVGTPPDEDGSADLSHVLSVARAIAGRMNTPKIIVNKSTVPVGTGDKVETLVADILRRRGMEIDFEVISNPEFLKEGSAIKDFSRPDRIIIGTDSPWAVKVMRELYAPFSRNHDKLMIMDRRSAELTKYAANAMLATKISFMNEMAHIAERVGADIEQVRLGIGADERIGYHFIYAGCGYGGSCFPKDVKALISMAHEVGVRPDILQAVEERNRRQKEVLFEKISQYFNGNLKGRVIALWGLAFKPGTDDMREAPSRALMEALWRAGASVRAYDPVARNECRRIYGERPDLTLCETSYEALKGADALAIVTEWKMFKSPDFEAFRKYLKHPVIFDGRNLYDPSLMRRNNIEYFAIGRPATKRQGATGLTNSSAL